MSPRYPYVESLLRYKQPGWELAAMNDPAGRRGIWYRATFAGENELVALEVCGGREGDDAYARFEVHEHNRDAVHGLLDVLERAAWAVDMARDEGLLPRVDFGATTEDTE